MHHLHPFRQHSSASSQQWRSWPCAKKPQQSRSFLQRYATEVATGHLSGYPLVLFVQQICTEARVRTVWVTAGSKCPHLSLAGCFLPGILLAEARPFAVVLGTVMHRYRPTCSRPVVALEYCAKLYEHAALLQRFSFLCFCCVLALFGFAFWILLLVALMPESRRLF